MSHPALSKTSAPPKLCAKIVFFAPRHSAEVAALILCFLQRKTNKDNHQNRKVLSEKESDSVARHLSRHHPSYALDDLSTIRGAAFSPLCVWDAFMRCNSYTERKKGWRDHLPWRNLSKHQCGVCKGGVWDCRKEGKNTLKKWGTNLLRGLWRRAGNSHAGERYDVCVRGSDTVPSCKCDYPPLSGNAEGSRNSWVIKITWKIVVLICHPVTSRPLISCRKKQLYLPVKLRDHPFDSLHSEFWSPLKLRNPWNGGPFATPQSPKGPKAPKSE